MCQALCQALHTYYITREIGELQNNIVWKSKKGKFQPVELINRTKVKKMSSRWINKIGQLVIIKVIDNLNESFFQGSGGTGEARLKWVQA